LPNRALEPAIAFPEINIASHTANIWDGGHHKLSFTTLPWAAKAVAEILLRPDQTKNKVLPVRAFEASQNNIVNALERIQGVKYDLTQVIGKEKIADAKKTWAESKNGGAALVLVKAGFLLDGYGSDFVGEGIVEVANNMLGLEELRLEDVVREAVSKV
jgi:hypothetical protein